MLCVPAWKAASRYRSTFASGPAASWPAHTVGTGLHAGHGAVLRCREFGRPKLQRSSLRVSSLDIPLERMLATRANRTSAVLRSACEPAAKLRASDVRSCISRTADLDECTHCGAPYWYFLRAPCALHAGLRTNLLLQSCPQGRRLPPVLPVTVYGPPQTSARASLLAFKLRLNHSRATLSRAAQRR